MVSRYAIDVVLIVLFIKWAIGKKKRRKKFLNKKVFFRLALLFVTIYVLVPQFLSNVVPRAAYFPQFLEAHKLRAYYYLYALVIPGKSAGQAAIEQEIRAAANKHGLEYALVRAVVQVESGYNQFALSQAGGCGLMQVLPNTFYSLTGGNPFTVRSNLQAGTKYLRRLKIRYNGDLTRTIAAYNAGPTNVDRYGGIPPFGETQRYVNKVLGHYRLYKGGV